MRIGFLTNPNNIESDVKPFLNNSHSRVIYITTNAQFYTAGVYMKHVTSFLYLTLMLICSLLIPTTASADNVVYQQGKASWYGTYHHGRKTASGERFNMNGLSAAHRTLPLGTLIEVTNKDTGKSVTVKVNDRGPYHGNRILDLSKGAANQLGMLKSGVGNIQISVLSKPEPRIKRKSVVDKLPIDNFKTAPNHDIDIELMALSRKLYIANGNKLDVLPPNRSEVFKEDSIAKVIEDVETDPLQRLISDIDSERYTAARGLSYSIRPVALKEMPKTTVIAILPTDYF
jgi:hypothetical protein